MATLIGAEFKHAVHIKKSLDNEEDIHLIKERLHFDDGTTKPNLKVLKNFKRPFWVTKKGFRDHKEKKEWEDVSKLQKFECVQSDLRNEVAKALDVRWSKDHLKQLSASPYLYGSDVDSKSWLKFLYTKKFENKSLYSVCFFDTETDMVLGHKEVIMASVVYERECFTAITSEYLKGFAAPEQLIEDLQKKLLPEVVKQRGYNFNIIIVDGSVGVIKACFDQIHKWQPDIVAIWNIDFDVPKMEENLLKHGVNPAVIFSDPSVPAKLQFFKYKQGPKKKTTASGKQIPIEPSMQWHTVDTPASYSFYDGMCVYRLLRLQQQQLQSYSLDNVLTHEKIAVNKLMIPEAAGYVADKFHTFMQTYKKIEYIVYNQIDVISFQMLDEKTKDLSSSMPTYSPNSDFYKFNSQPKRIVDGLFFYLIENRDRVIGTVGQDGGSSMRPQKGMWDHYIDEDQDGEEVANQEYENLGLKGWVVTLQAHNIAHGVGLKCIQEDSNEVSNIRGLVYDADATAAYPSATQAGNVSKETTKREMISIEGIDKYVFMMENINLLSGPVNATEYCQQMMGFPSLDKLYNKFMQDTM